MASAEEHQVLARGWACHHGPPVFGAAHVLRSTLTPDPDCEYGCARRRPGPQDGPAGWPVAASAGAVLAGGPGTACQPADRRLRFVMKMASSRRGVPGLVLVDFAHGSADLLIVGAGQRRPLARIRCGRVARYCLAHAECLVLAVPPSALAGQTGHGLRVMAFRTAG